MRHYLVVMACLAGLLMSACSAPQGPNETGGMLVGGLAGGLLGSQFGGGSGAVVGAGLGTLAGGFAGKTVGKSMDDQKRQRSAY